MASETAAFSESIRQRTCQLECACPGLDVFSVTADKLIECAEKINFQPTAQPDYVVVANLGEQLEKLETFDSFWTLAFIDLWYCSNFHGRLWGRLGKSNRAYVRFAIQTAYYVWAASGKNQASDLSDFIDKTGTRTEALAYLEAPELKEDLRRWASSALRSKSRKSR